MMADYLKSSTTCELQFLLHQECTSESLISHIFCLCCRNGWLLL